MSFIFEGIQRLWDTLLYSLGLKGKSGSILFLGLDNAGKTTLLHRLKTGGDIRSFPPTDRPSHEKFTLNGTLHFTAWDLGGHEAVRYLWEDYVSTQVSAVLFLIDAADTERLEESAYELDSLIIGERLLQDIPVAILLNKCDLHEALPSQDIIDRLEYDKLEQEQGREYISMFRISVLQGQGYQDAFQWVSKFL